MSKQIVPETKHIALCHEICKYLSLSLTLFNYSWSDLAMLNATNSSLVLDDTFVWRNKVPPT